MAAALIVGGFFALNANAVITTINLSSPVGNEILRGTVNITWTSNGESTDTVEVSYSTNDFYNDTRVVIDSVPNTGIYAWNTTTIPDGNNYRIQVKNVANSANSRSPLSFTIDNTPPTTPTILTPNGGQILKGGDTYNITWTPTTDVNPSMTPITIEYASDGSTFVPIATNEADDGSYTWTIPSDNTTAAKIRVISIDLASNTSSDVSDAAFTIDSIAPTIPVANIVGTTIQGANDTVAITFNEPVFAAGGWASAFTSITGSFTQSLTLTNAGFNYSGNTLTITLNEATDGMYLRNGETITVDPVAGAIRDAAGNSLSDAPVVGTTLVTGDSAAPTVALTYDPDRPVRDVDTVTITVTFNETIRGISSIAIDTAGVDVLATPMSGSGLVWTYSWDVPAGSDGVATIIISGVTDLAGNANATATNNTRTIDNTDPNTVINSPDANSWHNTGFSLSVSDTDSGGSGLNICRYKVNSKIGADWVLTKDWTSRTCNATTPLITIGAGNDCQSEGRDGDDGKCRVTVDSTDLAGNPDSTFRHFSIDWTPPDAATISIAGGAVVTKNVTPTLTLTPGTVAPDFMRFSCNGANWSDWVAWATTYNSFNLTTGAGCSVSDGAKTVYVSVEDAHNNIQTTVNSDSIIYDSDNKLTVGSGKDFITIQAAIDAATPNDTIEVAAGDYTENVNVNKSLILQGVGNPTVTALNPAVSVFNVIAAASPVNISGFTITGANVSTTAGIYLGADVTGCNIHDNILTGNGDGIWLGSGSNHNILANNTLSSNYQGFEVYHSDYNTFTNNHSDSNNVYGFKMESADHNTFTGNTANSNAKYGFYLAAGSSNSDNNTFTNNTANSNTEYGMRINSSNGNTLTTNTFNLNVIAGIRLKDDITNLVLNGNSFTNSQTGIDIASGAGSVTSWTVSSNNISGNTTYGVNNSGTGILDARVNWWGHWSGPHHSTNPLGTGNAVTDNVTFSKWCTNDTCTTFGSNSPLAQLIITTAPGDSVAIPNPITLTITGKDSEGITRVNDNTTQAALTADRGAAFGSNLVTLANGVGSTNITNTVMGLVNILASQVGGLVTGTKQVTFTSSDAVPPTISGHIPANGATGVSISAAPYVIFSEALSGPTVNSTNIQLKKYSDDSLVPATVSLVEGGTKVIITPSSPLLYSTQYYFTVSAGVQDLAGNALSGVLDISTKSSHQFITTADFADHTPPTISSHFPTDNASGISVNVAPYIIFSEALKASTVNSANIQLKKDSDNSTVAATISLVEGGIRVIITPASNLDTSTQYYFAVSTGVQDEAGNALAAALDSGTKADHEFTTATDTADHTAPFIVSHTPADNATDVTITIAPYLTFSEALKATTISSTNIQLKKDSDDSTIAATVSLVEGGTRVVITPNSSLANDTQYYFAVSTSVQDEAGNALATALDSLTKDSHEFRTVAVVPIVVDEVIVQNNNAAATDSYLAGWHYTFRITVNTDETDLSVKFTDWVNSADPTKTVAANGNMRLLFNTSTGNGLGSIVGLTDADIIAGVGPIHSFAIGNQYEDQTLLIGGVPTPTAIDLDTLDISTDLGRQIKFDVFTKLPLPPTTVPGFYTTTYGIQVN